MIDKLLAKAKTENTNGLIAGSQVAMVVLQTVLKTHYADLQSYGTGSANYLDCFEFQDAHTGRVITEKHLSLDMGRVWD